MTKLTPRSKKIVDKAIAAIKRMPDSFDMQNWIKHNTTTPASGKMPKPYCGTEACLAGHIALAATRRLPDAAFGTMYRVEKLPKWLHADKAETSYHPVAVDCQHIAERVLGDVDGEKLFYFHRWPYEFVRGYWAKSPKEKAKTAVARLRHFLKTGK